MVSSWKNTLQALSLAFVFSALLTSCSDDKTPAKALVSPSVVTTSTAVIKPQSSLVPAKTAWSAHIAKLPQAFVSASKPLTLEFTHPVSGDSPLNLAMLGLIEVEPKIAFKSYFESDRRIKIEWLEALDRDTQYEFFILPQKLDAVDNNLAPYTFSVKPLKQDISVQINGLQIDSASNDHTITGYISANDLVNAEQMLQLIVAKQDGKNLAIDWEIISDTKFTFTIKHIKRSDKQSLVKIAWNGKVIGVNKQGSQGVEIPSLTSFEITGVIGHQTTEQFIEINFSEPLDRYQNLKGLIKIDDKNPKNTRVDGNRLKVYPRGKLSGEVTLTVSTGIKSTKHSHTRTEFSKALTFLSEKPGVRFFGNKYILPKQGDMNVTIEAVNVNSVQITAYRTPVNNLGQFLQSSNLSSGRVDTRTSAIQWRKTYYLPEIPKDKWQKFDLNIENISADFGNDLLGLEVKIDRSNIILDCGQKKPAHNDVITETNSWPTANAVAQPDWVHKYYKTQGYSSWRDRDNPCKDYFYRYGRSTVKQFRYFTSSDIGMIAKMAVDHKIHVVVTDINSAVPMEDVTVKAYNYQHQPVAESVTNDQGIAAFYPVSAPYYLIAEKAGNLSFMKISRNEALSTNVFDVGGEKTASGVKGFFYGERGVWRPGDDIFLTFIVQDKTGNFPENYPLTLDFFDPKGIKKHSITQTNPLNGFYHFKLSTDENAATGNWRAVIRYGNQYFDKQVPVEAIMPNRLKIELAFPNEQLSAKDNNKDVGVFSQWLNGAPANRLKADIKMIASTSKTRVAGFDSYVFDDPSRKLKSRSRTVYEGKLDASGKAAFKLNPYVNNAPGQVMLNFTTRVFEKSGNFSTQYLRKSYIPYDQLVGINIPKGSGWNNSISRDEKHKISFLSVDPAGERKANTDLEFSVYRIGWRWWWDYSNDNVNAYVNGQHSNRVVNQNLSSDKNGNAAWELDGKSFDWGRYLLRVCDKQSDHCSGKVVYLGWSYNNNKNPSGETQLMLTMDKKEYQVGDTAYLTIPQVIPSEEQSARFLLTLESGTKIVSQRWITGDIENNRIAIAVTEAMMPNVYAHVTLIQAYQDKKNDRPIRMYGIAPIMVESAKTQLDPVITTAETVRPESTMKVDVSESQGKSMTYTLAIVDEGLLGITNYKTPNPHKAFYKREALGVLTWDIYDLLAQSQAATFNSLITLGGGDKGDGEDGQRNKRRFPPVVKFIGPFVLAAGQSQSHKIKLPEYMGAVRVMVVAANQAEGQGVYGVVEKTVTVTQPLTLLATLPRVLGPNEDFSLPVSIFANTADIKTVTLAVKANDLFSFDTNLPTVSFDKPGDKIVNLAFKTNNAIGSGVVTITATSQGQSISQTVNIPVRSANSAQVVTESVVVEAGSIQRLSITPNGMLNTNDTYVEISRVPDINLADRLDYLIKYPHGCLEQTTSKLFPQIYLKSLITLEDKQSKDIDHFVREGIRKLQTFQNAEGAFNYWPNGSYYNRWANSYAGHFLLEAKRLGYVVPSELLNKWLKSQQRLATSPNNKKGYESTEAYTLYTLALANKTDFNAMNRLKERINSARASGQENSNIRLARWLLAASYARSGVQDAAQALMTADQNTVSDYEWSGYTYGSSLRDASVLMLAQSELKNHDKAWESALDIAEYFKRQSWYSTQSTAWALTALSNYFSANQADEQLLSYRVNNGAWQQLSISSPIYKQSLASKVDPISIEIKNESGQNFYALLGNRGIPANAQEKASQSYVAIDVSYTDMKGNAIQVDALKQGEDFKARVTVTALDKHARLENLALTMTMPSGWQISNDRLEGKGLAKGLEYQDFRDDRVLSYFTLGRYYWYHRFDNRSITVEATLNASFKGRFYLPGWHVESMYDRKVKANTVGQWVKVIEDESI